MSQAPTETPNLPTSSTSSSNPSHLESRGSVDPDSFFWQQVSKLLVSLENHSSVIPDRVIAHYLAKSGCNTNDPAVLKLVSLATHKYIRSIATDARAHHAFRTSSYEANKNITLTDEDFRASLLDNGVDIEHLDYFIDENES